MNIGDVVAYRGSRWRVITYLPGPSVFVLANAQERIEAPNDAEALEDLKVLFNPGESWPFVSIPLTSKGGPIVSVSRGNKALVLMVDWVPSDFTRAGGSIFFSPALHLRKGEILSATHKLGVKSRINITQAFGTAKSRQQRAANPPKISGPKSIVDRLIDDNPFEDD